MKKLLTIVIACVIIVSCNNSSTSANNNDSTGKQNPGDTSSGNASNATDSSTTPPVAYAFIDEDDVRDMAKHFYTSPLVKHDRDAEFQSMTFDRSKLQNLLDTYRADRFRLITAAYLDTDPKPDRRNTKTMILQFRSAGRFKYVDILEVDPGALCPPPNGTCDIEGLFK